MPKSEYLASLQVQLEKLSSYLSLNHGEEIGRGDPRNGESAVEVAIRLMDTYVPKS